MVILSGLEICEIGTIEDIIEIPIFIDCINAMHFEVSSDDHLPILGIEISFIKRMSLTYIYKGRIQGQKAWELKSYFVSENPIDTAYDERKLRQMISAINAFTEEWPSDSK
jgi:hypothetical protein